MSSYSFNRFFGIQDIPEEAKRVLKVFFFIYSLILLSSGMGQTFIILHYIQLFNYKIAGFLFAVIFFSQLVTDYPSGALGDFIGQRTVLSLSLVFFSVGFFIISQFENYSIVLISSIFIGLGQGQMSGALESWLDNNYRIGIGEQDKDRKIYGFAMHRIGTLTNFIFGSSFIIGGILSTFISRTFVFALVSLLLLLIIPMILYFLRDLSPEKPIEEQIPSKRSANYFKYLKGGLKFLVSSRESFFLLTGLAVIELATTVWFTLILFPIYNGYTGTDGGVGFMRSFIFILGGFIRIYSATLSKKVSNDKLPLFYLAGFIGLFGGIIILTSFIPPLNTFNLLGIILVLLIMAVTNPVIFAIAMTLRQRIFLEKIPSEYRNSIYSLLPTLSILLQIPTLIYVGQIIELYDLKAGLGIILVIGIIGCMLLFISQMTSVPKPTDTPSIAVTV